MPRVINRLCDRALHHGYLRRVGVIDREILEAAIPDALPPASASPRAASPAPRPRAQAPQAARVKLSPEPGPEAQNSDPIDEWLASADESPAPLVPRPQRPAAPLSAADAIGAHQWVPGELPEGSRKRGGFVLRPTPVPTAVQSITDRWLRRLGAATVAIGLGGTVLFGAPTMMDISNDLVRASTALVAAPESLDPPPAPPTKLAPALAMPSTPDVLIPEVAGSTPEKGASGL